MDSTGEGYDLYLGYSGSDRKFEVVEQWFDKDLEIRQWLSETWIGAGVREGGRETGKEDGVVESGAIVGWYDEDRESYASFVEISSFHSINGEYFDCKLL